MSTSIDIGNGPSSDFQFYDSSAYNSSYTNAGYDSSSDMNMVSGSMEGSSRTKTFLTSKGLGWLMEVQDEEDSQLPLLEELDIDITDIYYKIRCVLLPLPYFRMKLDLVREAPDFWGPLVVVVSFALLSLYGQFSVVSWILTMWFSGGFMIWFITRALGGDVNYSQVLGIVGYCLLPLVVTGLFSSMFRSSFISNTFGIFGIVWSVYSAGTLLCAEDLQTKKPLVLYPVFLLYIYFYSLYSGV